MAKVLKKDKPKNPLRALRNDERLQKFSKMLAGGLYQFDTEKHIKEIKTLHSTRSIRTLDIRDLIDRGHKKLLIAVNNDLSYRSRIVEIKVDVEVIVKKLEDHVDRMKRYLISTYGKELTSAKLITVSARNDFINNLLDKGFHQIADLKSLCKFADIIIDDIDEAKWRVNSINNILTLNLEREKMRL